MDSFRTSLTKEPYYHYHSIRSGIHNSHLILKQLNKELLYGKKAPETDNPAEYCRHILAYIPKRPDVKDRITTYLQKHFPFLVYYENTRPGSSVEVLTEYLGLLQSIVSELNTRRRFPETIDIPTIRNLFEYTCAYLSKKTIAFNEEEFIRSERILLREGGQLTFPGFCFFICLFLDKRQASAFLQTSKVFAEEECDFRKSVSESFTSLCCKLPHAKHEQSNIALDILNELNRCPKELFNLLGDEDKKAFYPNGERHGTIQAARRYCDRFPHLALRYFDHSKALDGITFHLQLGHRHKEEAHTKSVNSVVRTHHILKPMRTFSKLTYYRNMEADSFFNSEGEIESYIPQYRITGNRVGLLLDMPGPSGYEVVKKNVPPHAIISTHELGALFFYNHLYGQKLIKTSPKELIAAYIRNFNRFITDLQAGDIKPVAPQRFDRKENTEDTATQKKRLAEKLKPYGLKVSYLPDACKDYLLSHRKGNKERQVKDKLRRMVYDTKRHLKLINSLKEKKENTLYKKQINDRLSRALAKDIVYLTPPHEVDRRGVPHLQKIGNMEFEVMQKMLAYFSTHKQELRNYLNILSIQDRGRNKWLHPFLHKVVLYDLDACDDLTDFYSRYYERRERWLLGMVRLNLSDKKWALLKSAWEISGRYNYFLKLGKEKPALKKDYSKETILLPTGLFDKEITEAMRKAGYAIKEAGNTAYCVKVYYDGLSQNFYSLPRYYNAAMAPGERESIERDELKNKINTLWNKVDEPSRKKLKAISKYIKQTESEILLRQYNDRIMFLMANELLPESAGFKKEDIERIGFNLPGNALDKPCAISETIHGKTIIATLPIGGYGEFRNFMKNHKLSSLLKYYPEGKHISLGEIKCREELNNNHVLAGELRVYEERKKELLEQMHLFEQTIHEKHNGNRKPLEAVLSNSGTIPSAEAFAELRKDILCDHIPHKEWIKENISSEGDKLVADRIISLLLNVYKETNKTLSAAEN